MDPLTDVTIIRTVKDRLPDKNDFSLESETDISGKKTIIVCPDTLVLNDNPSCPVVTYQPSDGLVSAINDAISIVRTSWILLLDEYEKPDWKFLEEYKLEKGNVYFGLIESSESCPLKKQHYEIRLFPKKDILLFSGHDIPYISNAKIEDLFSLSNHVISIVKLRETDYPGEYEQEMERAPDSARVNLLYAIQLAGEGDHKKAVVHFRNALNSKKLNTFDYTGALNGLANSMAELNHWKDARLLIDRSLAITTQQKMPYLVLYNIARSNRNWNIAGEYLEEYLAHYDQPSRTNYDVTLHKVDCHYLLADAAFRSGNYRSAFMHYEKYYELKEGNISDDLLERLFIYSVELSDYDKSKQYFMDLFGNIPGNQGAGKKYVLMNEALSLFVDKGWTDFACYMYEKIYQNNQDDNEILRRWIAALIKGKEIEKARFLLSKSSQNQMATVAE